ncbi:26S proteasome regulatory complex component [Giardia muris]|uniref:26S proteasome regulatory complex component n=1 Tax=Giardia muris TaxID=5742 RepID=A0A4Z1SWB7_GIAMU|nr:26S proteasome regulatory complex component [Giardia muris]|eukprot:TNJ30036.1 26S proteasome regulatory complex component [Giardia muris]
MLSDTIQALLQRLPDDARKDKDWEDEIAKISPEETEEAIALAFESAAPPIRVTILVQGLIANYAAQTFNYATVAEMCGGLASWAEERSLAFVVDRAKQDKIDALIRVGDPLQAIRAVPLVENLISEIKKKDTSAQYIKAQLLAAELLTLAGNYSKGRSHIMSARALTVKLTPELHARLDAASGCVYLCSEDYNGAAGYYQEAVNLGYPCLGQLVLLKIFVHRFFEVETVMQNRNKYATAERVQRFPKYMLDADNAVLPIIRQIGLLIEEKLHKSFLQSFNQLVAEALQTPHLAFEVKILLERLQQREVHIYITRLLRPYKRVELSYMGELMGLDEVETKELISKMLMSNSLPFVIDEATENLVRVDAPDATDVQTITEATKTIELMQGLLASVLS